MREGFDVIPVYICEDEPQQLKAFKKSVSQIIKSENLMGLKLVCVTKDPMEILVKVNCNEMAIYFLDIQLGENKMNGLDLASKIRERNSVAYIILITAYDFAIDTYRRKINVKDYIVKGNPKLMVTRIKENLHDAYAYSREIDNSNYLSIKNAHNIRVDEIYYIRVPPNEKRKINIIHKTGVSTAPITLKEVSLQRLAGLIQCERSYIININHVRRVDRENNCVVMENGEAVPSSRRHIIELGRMLSLLRHK